MKHLFTLLALFSFSLFAQTVPNYVPTNGLVGWWPFNGNANDLSGNGNNGTVNGAILSNDRNGAPQSSYSFDGVNDMIRVSHTSMLNLSMDFSLSAWYRTAVFPTHNTSHTLIAKRDENGSCCQANVPYNFTINYTQNGINFRRPMLFFSSNSNTLYAESIEQLNLNQWHHLISTYDNDTLKIYIDGALAHSQWVVNSARGMNNSDLLFGGINRSNGSEYLNGDLDDIGIWNRALSDSEIQGLYLGCIDSIADQPQNCQAFTNPGWANFTCKSSSATSTYQWQQSNGAGWVNLTNFGLYSGANSDSLVINGITGALNNFGYRCIVTSCDTDTSNVAVLTVSNGAGVDESSLNSLFLRPNPTSGIVRFNQPIVGSYRVITPEGRVVQKGEMGEAIDLSAYPDGIYQIEVQSSNERRTFKAVKQR